jgi:hypothetical protein
VTKSVDWRISPTASRRFARLGESVPRCDMGEKRDERSHPFGHLNSVSAASWGTPREHRRLALLVETSP